jgi:hypothetical protein
MRTVSVVIKLSLGVRVKVSGAEANGNEVEKDGKSGSPVKSNVQVVDSSIPSPVVGHKAAVQAGPGEIRKSLLVTLLGNGALGGRSLPEAVALMVMLIVRSSSHGFLVKLPPNGRLP